MLNRNNSVYQQVNKIANNFGIFDCIPCARAIKEFLVEQGVRGKHIKLDTGSQDPLYGRIYDDSINELIATTGHHEGIAVEINKQEIVFYNIVETRNFASLHSFLEMSSNLGI
jgi:Papain fold toxin 2